LDYQVITRLPGAPKGQYPGFDFLQERLFNHNDYPIESVKNTKKLRRRLLE
jgi:hypothetical protein